MKKLICLIICAMLIIPSTTVYADIPKFHYSFEEAAKIALENTPEYKGIETQINKLSDAYDAQEKMTPKDIRYVGNMKYFISQQVDPQVSLENTYYGYKSAVLGKQNIKRNVLINLRKAVIGVSKAEMACTETEIGKKNKQKELELLEINYKNGLISKNDYDNSKRKIKDEIKALDDGEKAVDMAYRQLNLLLGREDEKDIVVHLDDTIIPLEKLDMKQIKKDMIDNGKTATDYETESLINLKEERRLKDYRYGLIKERYDKYDLDKFTDNMRNDIEDMYEEAKRDYEAADKKYENALSRFDKSFDDLIEDILDLYDDIEDAKKEIADEKNNQSLYKVKYDAGKMSKIEYDALQDKIILLENKLKNAELDLNMKYAELLIYSDLKKVVLE